MGGALDKCCGQQNFKIEPVKEFMGPAPWFKKICKVCGEEYKRYPVGHGALKMWNDFWTLQIYLIFDC